MNHSSAPPEDPSKPYRIVTWQDKPDGWWRSTVQLWNATERTWVFLLEAGAAGTREKAMDTARLVVLDHKSKRDAADLRRKHVAATLTVEVS